MPAAHTHKVRRGGEKHPLTLKAADAARLPGEGAYSLAQRFARFEDFFVAVVAEEVEQDVVE